MGNLLIKIYATEKKKKKKKKENQKSDVISMCFTYRQTKPNESPTFKTCVGLV